MVKTAIAEKSIREKDVLKDNPLNTVMSVELIRAFGALPLYQKNSTITIAAEANYSLQKLADLQFTLGKYVRIEEKDKAWMEQAFRQAGLSAQDQGLLSEDRGRQPENRSTQPEKNQTNVTNKYDDTPTIQLVNDLVNKAIKINASDIHVEPLERELRIRYRIDGVLHNAVSLPIDKKAAVISRLKIMADLDIAEKRRPQDGRIRHSSASLRMNGDEKTIDIRVSSLPTDFGEKMVLRILDKSSFQLQLENLGFKARDIEHFKRAVQLPHGMVLVTGPTGSGKTTTLYSALNDINTPGLNIVTIEDPIEYNLAGINQSHVRSDIGYTFASALRSFLRQDPDIIMVGEIRDTETAEIGIRASLTGHLVLSTLHTNDAPTAITRLLDMGLEPFLISSSVTLIMAQRLVRKICPHCREVSGISMEALKKANMDLLPLLNAAEEVQLFRGKGCPECAYTGYRGRTGIFEVMPMSAGIQELVVNRATAQDIRELAIKEGMSTLRHDAILKLKDGITSLEEVLRETASL